MTVCDLDHPRIRRLFVAAIEKRDPTRERSDAVGLTPSSKRGPGSPGLKLLGTRSTSHGIFLPACPAFVLYVGVEQDRCVWRKIDNLTHGTRASNFHGPLYSSIQL